MNKAQIFVEWILYIDIEYVQYISRHCVLFEKKAESNSIK